MKESLESLQTSLSSLQVEGSSDLLANTKHWLKQMEPIEYACLGCEYCFPATAMNVFHKALPEISKTQPLSCAFEVSEQNWPPVVGEYYAFCDGAGCSVAVLPSPRNVIRKEVETFRKQVEVVDMIGCEDEERIVERIEELSQRFCSSCSSKETGQITRPIRPLEVPIIHAEEPVKVEMDKVGYFVILPQPEKQTIVVEHYSYDNTLQRVIEGKDARSVYWTIIRNSWVTQLSHAAYLGKELAKAELSIKLGVKYVQDGA